MARYQELDSINRRAWERLYGSTEEMVWGRTPCEAVKGLISTFAPGLPKNSVILDAGCGEGRHLPLLARTGADTFGCDSSSAALKKARMMVGEGVNLVSCRLEALPLLSGSLDLVLAVDLFETLPLVHVCLGELWRCLKPGGLLLCNLPEGDEEIVGIDMAPIGAGKFLYKGDYFYRYFSVEEAHLLFEGVGFRVEKVLRRSWREGPHPNFRAGAHGHRSIFYLLRSGID